LGRSRPLTRPAQSPGAASLRTDTPQP
jgi:hypothetical protein